MPMTPTARALAIYNQIAAGPNFSKLSSSEQNALKAQLQSIWGDGDLVYIQANALVSTTDVVTIPVTSPPGTPSAGTGVGTGTIS